MLLKTVSSGLIIAKLYRDFGITHNGWETDAIEWIGDALSIIGHSAGLVPASFTINVKNYQFRIPCGLDTITSIVYNGVRLKPTMFIGQPKDITDGNYYTLNSPYINTPFEEGCVYLTGKAVPVDDKGYPMIPDGQWHKEAISMHCIMKLTMGGYNHPVFNFDKALALWERYYPRAQNEGMFPSVTDYERFRRMFTGWTFDKGLYDRGMLESNTIGSTNPPTQITKADTVRTIIHVETNTTDDVVGGGDL